MTKKGKLFGSIAVLLLLAIMIPVALFAASPTSLNIRNTVKYYATDLEGKFYYAIVGNATGTDGTVYDVGVVEVGETTKIRPVLLFNAFYNETSKEYNVQDIDGNAVNNELPVPNSNDILFDKDHDTITYYFVFTNETLKNTTNEQEGLVNVSFSDTGTGFSGIDAEKVSSGWQYTIVQDTSKFNTLEFNPDTYTWKSDSLSVNVAPEKKDTLTEAITYSYVVLKYEIHVDEAEKVIQLSGNLKLTVNLENVMSVE